MGLCDRFEALHEKRLRKHQIGPAERAIREEMERRVTTWHGNRKENHSMTTSVAVVALTASGQPMKGGVVHLESGNGDLLFDITNPDGYSVFKVVPLPFVGVLKLAGTIDYYERPVSIPDVANVTLRVGGSRVNPQDIVLDPCVPFV